METGVATNDNSDAVTLTLSLPKDGSQPASQASCASSGAVSAFMHGGYCAFWRRVERSVRRGHIRVFPLPCPPHRPSRRTGRAASPLLRRRRQARPRSCLPRSHRRWPSEVEPSYAAQYRRCADPGTLRTTPAPSSRGPPPLQTAAALARRCPAGDRFLLGCTGR